ncbi:MAG: ABC transporter permease [Chloroflexota bacterium]|jgi:putative spermidine/putrescine transport system permease protein
MTDTSASAPGQPTAQTAGLASGGAGSRRLRGARNYLALIPFHVYIALFLILPTAIVAVGAFTTATGQPTVDNVTRLFTDETFVDAFTKSIELAVSTAIAGAIIGGLLAWAVVRGDPNGPLRQLVIAASGVLAQFGGVMLAFAFLATFGFNGLATMFVRDALHVDVLTDASWLYSLTGLVVVYTYFQIPLMLIVFLPSLDGLRQEWYDASASLGGSSWSFWRHVGGPILAPAFLGALLLLFTNAFSAYATAAALISQGASIVTLQIAGSLQSEVVIGQENVGKALALGMIIVVSLVMALYALIQRRASRWVK